MKKNNLRQKTDPDCDDDAFEVKNAMLMTALQAEANHRKATGVSSDETKRETPQNNSAKLQ
jgi:hypothetical protein